MKDVVSTPSRARILGWGRVSPFVSVVRSLTPSLVDCGLAIVSAVFLIFSFPDFNLWPLAWLSLIPLLVVIGRRPQPWQSFFAGWFFGSIFFYGSCYWLTYSMTHFGGLPKWLAYAMLVPGAILLGLFPAAFAMLLARAIRKWGLTAMSLAPFCWSALEWTRLECTGQLWNSIGYSQAFHPLLIGSARLGGVYAVGFLVVAVNSAVAFALLRHSLKALQIAAGTLSLVAFVNLLIAHSSLLDGKVAGRGDAVVIAIQPNVPMDLAKSLEDLRKLTDSHFKLSEVALQNVQQDGRPRLVIWPESPMYFTYGTDPQLRERIETFARLHKTSLLLNSQEVAPNDGIYNSALLINEQGSLVAQYDKIRLMPFGEYVPLPRWLPGAGLITAIVGDFTAGTHYRQMQVGLVRTGVFICIESAYPSIARRFTIEGADVLINISNDGYLGPTAVMRQHLANAVLRAVENGRPILRVTNTGITAFITPSGEVRDSTSAFRQEVRVWEIARGSSDQTFYAAHGDLFVIGCAGISLLVFALSFINRNERRVS
jgi:apolipoprotein N-acyltransferase